MVSPEHKHWHGATPHTAMTHIGHEVVLHARSVERAEQAGNIASKAMAIVVGDLSSGAETRGL